MREFFDFVMSLGVEGMMISPGYRYQTAPDQEHFLQKQRSRELFKQILGNPRRSWKFNLLMFVKYSDKRRFPC
jgi:hypothetical protein